MLKGLIEKAEGIITDFQADRWMSSKSYMDDYELEKKKEFEDIGIEYEMEEYNNKSIFNFNINFNFHIHLK